MPSLKYHLHFFSLVFSLVFSSAQALGLPKDEKMPPPINKQINKWGQSPERDLSFSLGIGSLIGHNNRVDNQTWPYNARTYVRVIPIGEFRYGPIKIFGPFVNWSLYQSREWGLSLKAGIQGDQYRGPGMTEREWSFAGGGSIRWRWIEFSYSRDVQNESNGSLYSLSTGPRFSLTKRIFLLTSVEATYMDKNYADYYYGVKANEMTPTRHAHSLDHAWTYSLSFRPIISITDRWVFMSSIKLSLYSEEIKSSPTVREGSGLSGILGLTYKFLP